MLLEHGRLRTDQLLSLVAALRKGDKRRLEGAARTCLASLVQSRYVQRARGCEAQRPQRPLPANVKVQTSSCCPPSFVSCLKLPDHVWSGTRLQGLYLLEPLGMDPAASSVRCSKPSCICPRRQMSV